MVPLVEFQCMIHADLPAKVVMVPKLSEVEKLNVQDG